jgi:F-type H+-transporting ATPase subunit b
MHLFLPTHLILADGMDLIMPQTGLGIWLTVTFLLVAALLKWKVWGPLTAAIDEREKSIHASLEKAKTEREAAEKLLAEQVKAVAEARKDAADMVRKSQAEVDKAKESLFAEARAEAAVLVKQARQQIEEEKQKALVEVKEYAVSLALDVASKLLAQKLDDAAHRSLAEEYVRSVPHTAPRVGA